MFSRKPDFADYLRLIPDSSIFIAPLSAQWIMMTAKSHIVSYTWRIKQCTQIYTHTNWSSIVCSLLLPIEIFGSFPRREMLKGILVAALYFQSKNKIGVLTTHNSGQCYWPTFVALSFGSFILSFQFGGVCISCPTRLPGEWLDIRLAQ